MKQIAILALTAFVLGSVPSFADNAQPSAFRKTLSSTPAAELPAKAVALVKQAKARDLSTRTVQVVQDAVAINPAAAPAVVGAIAKAMPDMAPIAASAAASAQPSQAAAIAKAATAAAPSKAGKIVAAVTRAVPAQYRNVAVSASEAAPTSGKEILNGVATARPELKPALERSMSDSLAGSPMQVAAALDSTAVKASKAGPSSAGPLPQGPIQNPPFVPPSGTPNSINPTSSGTVPPGGRSYASP